MHKLRDKRFKLLIMLFLIAANTAVFWQVLGNGFVNYDDGVYVVSNPSVQGGLTRDGIRWAFTTVHASNWHPITWISHILDCQLYGLKPTGHHLTSLLLHIANTLLLFHIFARMTGSLWRSAFAAALFAVHPLHVESVAWVAERKDVLSTLFWLLTMWTYVRYTESPRLKRYLPVVLVFALGLMAKPMLVTLPFALLLLDYWPLGRFTSKSAGGRKPGWKLVWEKAPLFALSAASGVVTYLAQQKGGAVRSLEQFALPIRAANAVVTYLSYIGKTVWPRGLAVFYPHPGYAVQHWQVAGAALLLTCLTVLVVSVGCGRRRPYLAVGWLWYLGTLVPVIGLVQVGEQAMADRYTYVPLIGLFIMVAWGIPDLLAGYVGARKDNRVLLGMAAGVLVSALAACAWFQVGHWRNSVSLFEHALACTSNNYIAHGNLGATLKDAGRLDDAIREYREAIRINPRAVEVRNNLGVALESRGEIDEAIREYRRAIDLNPRFADAHNDLGVALRSQGRIDQAIQEYRKAIDLKPNFAGAHDNLGNALVSRGKLEEAIHHYSESLRINPGNALAHSNLGGALAAQGKLDEAIGHYSAALRIWPELAEAHYGLGLALARQGKTDQAARERREAVRLKPELAHVPVSKPDPALEHFNMGVSFGAQGRIDEAIREYREAIRLKYDFAEAHANLGVLLKNQGKIDEAMREYKEAIGIKPGLAEAHNNMAVVLYFKGDYAEAWKEVRLCQKYGGSPPPAFLEALSDKCPPEP